MSPTADLMPGLVLTVLLVATGYHLSRLLHRPRQGLDGAHTLMGGVMLLMLGGWTGHSSALVWALVFVVIGIAGLFGTHRIELVIGSAAMVFMLVAARGPDTMPAGAMSPTGLAPAAERITALEGMAQMHGAAAIRHTQAAATSSAQMLTLILVVALIPALVAVVVGALLSARTGPAGPDRGNDSRVSVACRVGLNLAAVYMLLMMV